MHEPSPSRPRPVSPYLRGDPEPEPVTDDDIAFPSTDASDDVPRDTDDELDAATHSQTISCEVPRPVPPGPDAPELRIELEPRYEWGSLPGGTDPALSVLLTLTPSGPGLGKLAGGPAAHIVLALDVSASMRDADKFPAMLEALANLVDDLRSAPGQDVLLSLVVFARGAKTLLQAVPAAQLDTRTVIELVRSTPLLFGNYTDAVGALSRATRLALESHRSNRALPVRICLLTDGRPQDVEGAAHKIARIAHLPIDVDALAFGADADVDALKRIVCGRRGGSVKHVRDETLSDAFQRMADSARRVVARLALLRIQTARGVVGGSAHRFRPARHAFGDDAFVRGRVFEQDIGTLESGRAYSLLFQVRLPQTHDDVTEIGSVSLRVPGFGGAREFRCHLAVPRHRGPLPASPDPLVTEARTIVDAIGNEDPDVLLAALRARRKLYLAERRDPYLLEVVDKAIVELQTVGSLGSLTSNERAALTAHTASAGPGGSSRARRREYSFG